MSTQMVYFFRGFIGIAVLLGIAYAFSFNRKKISWRLVGIGMALQAVFAILVLKTKPGEMFFKFINDLILNILSFSDKGSSFIFGNLVSDYKIGAIFAFKVLPTIIFFSSLISVLYFLGVMQKVVELFAWIMMKALGTSGAETLSCSANIFVGQTEAPLLIKPYVETMTRSELLTVMTGGFATVAGGVMAAYVGMLVDTFPDIAGHLLSASIMNAPAAIYLSKMILPEEEEPMTKGTVKVELPITDANIIDAAANGAAQGLQLALNVGAMLLAFIALIAMVDAVFVWIGNLIHIKLSLALIFGWLFAPIAWVIGVPWKDCVTIGGLLGKRLVINEFVTYAELADMLHKGVHLEGRSVMIATYAMCGFANFSSIAIQIGGIGGLAPSRRPDLARLGIYGVIAGTLATFMSATIAGMITSKARLKLPEKQPTPSVEKAPESMMQHKKNFYLYAASQLGMSPEAVKSMVDITGVEIEKEKGSVKKVESKKRNFSYSVTYKNGLSLKPYGFKKGKALVYC